MYIYRGWYTFKAFRTRTYGFPFANLFFASSLHVLGVWLIYQCFSVIFLILFSSLFVSLPVVMFIRTSIQ